MPASLPPPLLLFDVGAVSGDGLGLGDGDGDGDGDGTEVGD